MSDTMPAARPTADTATISRRTFSLGVGLLLGSVLTRGADAKPVTPKNTIASIKKRVQVQGDMCEVIGGGTMTVTVRPGGTTTRCTGGTDDGRVCVNSSKRTRCYQHLETPPKADPGDGSGPPRDGGVASE